MVRNRGFFKETMGYCNKQGMGVSQHGSVLKTNEVHEGDEQHAASQHHASRCLPHHQIPSPELNTPILSTMHESYYRNARVVN